MYVFHPTDGVIILKMFDTDEWSTALVCLLGTPIPKFWLQFPEVISCEPFETVMVTTPGIQNSSSPNNAFFFPPPIIFGLTLAECTTETAFPHLFINPSEFHS